MIRPIIRDVLFLSRKSDPATPADVAVGRDLADTLAAHAQSCAGMAANMIGVSKRVIAVFAGPLPLVMYNPVITRRDGPYTAREGCLSLDGERTASRWREIEVEYLDAGWKARRGAFSGWVAQVVQHEMDHLEGVLI